MSNEKDRNPKSKETNKNSIEVGNNTTIEDKSVDLVDKKEESILKDENSEITSKKRGEVLLGDNTPEKYIEVINNNDYPIVLKTNSGNLRISPNKREKLLESSIDINDLKAKKLNFK